jgi:hypothetical protein
MKTDPRASCGQEAPPAAAQANRCLPFCGLGGQEYVQRKAALCGVLNPDKRTPDTAELADALTNS